jgi:hypothetical protein
MNQQASSASSSIESFFTSQARSTLAKNYETHMLADLHSMQTQMIPYTNQFKIKNPHPDSMFHDASANASERRDFAFNGD